MHFAQDCLMLYNLMVYVVFYWCERRNCFFWCLCYFLRITVRKYFFCWFFLELIVIDCSDSFFYKILLLKLLLIILDIYFILLPLMRVYWQLWFFIPGLCETEVMFCLERDIKLHSPAPLYVFFVCNSLLLLMFWVLLVKRAC